MTISPYLAGLRAKIGNDLLVLPGVAVVVRDADGRLLLVRDRESGEWGLPAGAIEPSESPSDAAHRELREETGIDSLQLELMAGLGGDAFRHTYPNGDRVEYAIFVYGGIAADGSVAGPRDDGEIAEARFFERDAAPPLGLPYPEDTLWGSNPRERERASRIQARRASMFIEYEGRVPNVAEGAYVAPNAVVRGDVVIHEGAAVLFGAVITAEGGRVEVGTDCVVMEQAVLRGTPRHPLLLGDRSLVGPGCHLTGCEVEPDCFVATGATIFNGARLGAGSEVRINGVVHVNSRLASGSVVPIGWVAVGDPAEVLPPNEHERIWEIQQTLDFPGTVFKSSRGQSRGERIRSYAEALQRQKKDRVMQGPDLGGD